MNDADIRRIVRGVVDELRERLEPRAYYTPPQVAKRLAVDPGKVIGWIRRGELRAVNIAERLYGRARWRIPSDELDAFIRRRTSSPPVETPRRAYGQRRPPVYRDDDIRWNYPPEHLVRLSAKAMPYIESWHENLEIAIERFRARRGITVKAVDVLALDESDSIQEFLKNKAKRTGQGGSNGG